jgi:Ca-activated chloride channel family protein
MTFLAPARLWLLLGAGVLAAVYVLAQLRRRDYTLKFTNLALLDQVAPRRPGWRRHVPAALFLVAMCTLVVGFAQPARKTKVPRERATVCLALDTSLSMQAQDVHPSRIKAAQSAATAFVDSLPTRINVGLVTFNGNASLVVAPTTDRDAVDRGIANAQLGERTAIGEAIYTCLDSLKQVPAAAKGVKVPARIVLMTDGTTTDGRPNSQAAAAAAKAHIPVSTIAFGTDTGTITIPQEPMPIPVPVDKAALQDIARTTGGRYYAAASESELKAVYQNIGSSVGFVTVLKDISTWFVGAALVIMLITGALSLLWFQRLP